MASTAMSDRTAEDDLSPEEGVVSRGVSAAFIDAFFSNDGKGSDKWEQYLSIYARELYPHLAYGRRIDLLEIGVQNGGSLDMWSKILPRGSGITGIDIDPKIGDLAFDNPDTRALVLDGTDQAALDRRFDGWSFDVVIDDGSHVCRDVLASFSALWKRVRPGGLYIVEDLHTSYHPSHGGGLRKADTSVEFFKNVADLLNADHVTDWGYSLAGQAKDLAETVASITFYDSVVVIQRALQRKTRPYRRLLSGDRFDVADNLSRMAVQPRDVLDSLLLSEGVGSRLSTALTSRVNEAERSNGEARQLLAAAESRLAEAEQSLSECERGWAQERAAMRVEAAEAATRFRRSLEEVEARAAASNSHVAEVEARAEARAAASDSRVAEVETRAEARAAASDSRVAEVETRAAELERRLHRLSISEESLRSELSCERVRGRELQDKFDLHFGEIISCLTLIDRVEPAPHEPFTRRVERLVESRQAALKAVPEIVTVMRQFRLRASVLEAGITHLRGQNRAFLQLLDDAAATIMAVSASRSFLPARAWARFNGRVDPLRHAIATQAVLLASETARQFSVDALRARSIPDVHHYAENNPDLVGSEEDLQGHFFAYGAFEGRAAHPDFDAQQYEESNLDVAEAGVPAFMHYILSGAEEDRPLALKANAEQRLAAVAVRLSGILPGDGAIDPMSGLDDALALIRSGGSADIEEGTTDREGMDIFLDEVIAFSAKFPSNIHDIGPTSRPDSALILASGLFDAVWYASHYPDIPHTDAATTHFLNVGRTEGRAPNAFFDPAWYAAQDAGVGGEAAAFVHYLRFGLAEGRRPSHAFDPSWYAAHLSKEGVTPQTALRYHLEVGRVAGYSTSGDPEPVAVVELSSHAIPSARSLLKTFSHQWSAIPVQLDHMGARTVIVVTDSVDAHSLFGGVGTSLVFGVLMAKRLGASFRLVTRTTPPKPEALGEVLEAHSIAWNGPVEFAYVPVDGDASLFLGPLDTVVTTSWWTTAATLGSVPAQQIVYLLQEDERMFYPFGDTRLRCEEILARSDLRVVINSSLLAEHLRGPAGVPGLANRSVSFEPAFPAAPRQADSFRPDGKLNFFFYARPNHARNVYWRGIEVIERAVVEGIFEPEKWNFIFAGSDLPAMSISGIEPEIIAKIPWRDYTALTSRMDLGLCLMDTPHPSYPPIDLAAAGAVVVTNRHGNKSSLGDWSPNIITADIGVDDLLDALRHGAALARDGEARQANLRRGNIPRDWTEQFENVFNAIFSKEQ